MMKKQGFTLIEVLMTVAIFTLISYGLIVLVSNVFSSSAKQGSLLAGSDQARKAGFNLTNELRNASTGANGAYSVGQADAQTLILYSNADNQPDIERIRYYVTGGKLYKGITQPTGTTYNLGTEESHIVLDDLANGANPVFYYYDGSYDGNIDNFLAQPVNINDIRHIKLNLLVYKKGGIINTETYTVTASAAVRNLKTNLGD